MDGAGFAIMDDAVEFLMKSLVPSGLQAALFSSTHLK
jgi:hypothetical protein